MPTTDRQATVKVDYTQPFVHGIRELIENHLGGRLTVGRLLINERGRVPYDISGVITLSGELIGWTILKLPMGVAQKLARDYLQMEQLSPCLLHDCVGELTNVIVGRAKSSLEGHRILISPPRVVAGSNYAIPPQRGAVCLAIPCECQHGPLELEISIVESIVRIQCP